MDGRSREREQVSLFTPKKRSQPKGLLQIFSTLVKLKKQVESLAYTHTPILFIKFIYNKNSENSLKSVIH